MDDEDYALGGRPGEDEGEWEVEKLLAKRRNKETKEEEFKVLWAGFDGDEAAEGSTSWEPLSWLEEEGYEDLLLAFATQAKALSAQNQAESLNVPVALHKEYQETVKGWNAQVKTMALDRIAFEKDPDFYHRGPAAVHGPGPQGCREGIRSRATVGGCQEGTPAAAASGCLHSWFTCQDGPWCASAFCHRHRHDAAAARAYCPLSDASGCQ
jgi:hypothetical protein